MDYLGSYTRNKALVPKEYVDGQGGSGGVVIPSRSIGMYAHEASGTSRLKDISYVGVRFPTMGVCFLTVNATIGWNQSATTGVYQLAHLNNDDLEFAPSITHSASVQCAKDCDVTINSTGTINIYPREGLADGDSIRFAVWWRIAASAESGSIGYTDLNTAVQAMLDLAETSVQQDMTVTATGLAAGSNPTVSYDPATNVMSFGIPAGAKGETGATGSTGAAGADAKINGVNALTLSAGDGLSATQTGSTLTLALDLDNYDGGAF